MPSSKQVYCIDTNCLIQPWSSFYAPHRVEGYWEKIDEFAQGGIIFVTLEVKNELERVNDDLSGWVRGKKEYLVKEPDSSVTLKWKEIAEQFPNLTDNIRGRSLADPWVIAHAAVMGATVVTMEGKGSEKRMRIPDVCQELGIRCIDIYQFLDEVGFSFSATIKAKNS